MAYHEAFWVALASATPVIALAATVAVSDATRALMHDRPRPYKKMPAKKALRLSFSPLGRAYWLAAFTFFLSFADFSEALLSLARNRDDWPTPLSTALAEVSLALVLVQILLSADARRMRRRAERRNQTWAPSARLGAAS